VRSGNKLVRLDGHPKHVHRFVYGGGVSDGCLYVAGRPVKRKVSGVLGERFGAQDQRDLVTEVSEGGTDQSAYRSCAQNHVPHPLFRKLI
jgi:hypothetical protein